MRAWLTFAAFPFLVMGVATVAQQPSGVSQEIVAELDLSSRLKVGSVSAGTLCLPKGALYLSDFIADREDFLGSLRDIISASGLDEQERFRTRTKGKLWIALKGARAKLCARKWGVFGTGDTTALSGSTSFVFEWRSGQRSAATTTEINVVIGKDDGMTPRAILRSALRDLLQQIATSPTE